MRGRCPRAPGPHHRSRSRSAAKGERLSTTTTAPPLIAPRPRGALFTRRQHQGGGARSPRQGREAATKERTLDEGEHVATLGLAMGPRDCLSWGAWALFTSRKCSKCGAANDLLCRHRFGDSRSELCGKASLAVRLSSRSCRRRSASFCHPAGLGGRSILRCCSSALLPFLDGSEART